MSAVPYILVFVFFTLIEYGAILISSTQLKAIINEYLQTKVFVLKRPPHPLKVFLLLQKFLFFTVCALTIGFSLYLKQKYSFDVVLPLLTIIGFKIFSFFQKRKMPRPSDFENLDMIRAFQDDYQAFISSWKINLFIEIGTLTIGAIILSIHFRIS